MEVSKELMEKAKNAANADALQVLAKENGWDMNKDEAKAYFEELHKTGALSDEELENVTGGGCRKNGHLVVTVYYSCDQWRCKDHGMLRVPIPPNYLFDGHPYKCPECTKWGACCQCQYCRYTGGLWLCMNSQK